MNKNIIKVDGKTFVTDFMLVEDVEGIHIKKNEIDFLKKNDPSKVIDAFNEYLQVMYPDIDEKYRGYILIHNIASSEGKSNYKLGYKCEHCNTDVMVRFEINLSGEEYKYRINDKIELVFGLVNGGKLEKLFDYIKGINFGDQFIDWSRISDVDKESMLSYIDHSEYTKILNNLEMCRATLFGHGVSCCKDGVAIPKEQHIFGAFEIFDIIVNSKNLTTLYQLNHQLLSRGISLSDQQMMKPFERSIYIAMIIKKEKEEAEKNAKSRIS